MKATFWYAIVILLIVMSVAYCYQNYNKGDWVGFAYWSFLVAYNSRTLLHIHGVRDRIKL